MLKRLIITGLMVLSLNSTSLFAQNGGLGQNIQINTRFHSFVGKPSWVLLIRDIDHNQTIPYLFDITHGINYWQIFTYGRNYLIVSSTMQISTYQSRYNTFSSYKINNFCNLESNGKILRGESLYINIDGDLSPDSNTYHCQVTRFPENNFTVVSPNTSR